MSRTIDECVDEINKLEKENASLKDRLTHEVEMIEGAANDEIKKLKEENARLREALEHCFNISTSEFVTLAGIDNILEISREALKGSEE
jgi:regulator of replication initiation timing